MPRLYCCVNTCNSKDKNVTLINFPQGQEIQEHWKRAIGCDSDFIVTPDTRICSKHFRSGKRSLNPNSEDYIPSVFPQEESNRVKRTFCKTCRKLPHNCICSKEEEMSGPAEEEYYDEEEQEVSASDQEEQIEEEEEDVEEYQYEEEVNEDSDVPDDGQLMDTDDEDWTPGAEVEASKPRRTRRKVEKRPLSESEGGSSSDDSLPPPSKARKTPAAKVKVETPPKTPTPRNARPVAAATPKTSPSKATISTTTNDTSASTPKPNVVVSLTKTNNSTPIANNKRNSAVFTPKITQDTNLQARIKDLEEEHSRQLETLKRKHNMTVANLNEDYIQKIHKLKVEWEIEKSNLQGQIDYYKEALNQSGFEEEVSVNFRGGDRIVVIQPPVDEASFQLHSQ